MRKTGWWFAIAAIALTGCDADPGTEVSEGEPTQPTYPPLAGSEWVGGPAEPLIAIMLDGLRGSVMVLGKEYQGVMPAWRDSLSDEQIADVLSYLRKRWGNDAGAISAEEVARVRGTTKLWGRFWTAEDFRDWD